MRTQKHKPFSFNVSWKSSWKSRISQRPRRPWYRTISQLFVPSHIPQDPLRNLANQGKFLYTELLTALAAISDDVDSDLPVDPSGLDLEPFSELSTLICIRLRHQSEEEASSVRIVRAGSTRGNLTASGPSLDHDNSESKTLKPSPSATMSQDSEQRELSKKINEVIKAVSVQVEGASTGLNRRNRWTTTEKLTAGSSGGDTAVSGNVANAQAAARKSATNVSSFLPFVGSTQA
jgi:hypothetical protein